MNTFKIRDEFIKLGQLMKACGMVEMGSEAKEYILEGRVLVNGEVEVRRGRKIYPGDEVVFEGAKVVVE